MHNGGVHERLLSVIEATSSTGKTLFDLVKGLLGKHRLDIRDCVGDSFDGAANMSGKYNGLTAMISEVASLHVHTWCYSHSLNLVISDATSVCTSAMTLFGNLQLASAFFKQSYERMNEWEMILKETSGKVKRLGKIGETRWLSKSMALGKIFGSYDNLDNPMFRYFLMALPTIAQTDSFEKAARKEAKDLLDLFASLKIS